MSKLEIGAKVNYKTSDKAGKELWKSGVIHAVRKIDTKAGSRVISYLVDTGKDNHTAEVTYDTRDVEINKRLNDQIEKKGIDADDLTAVRDIEKAVSAQKDLPKSKVVTDTVRQPELIDVALADIKLAE